MFEPRPGLSKNIGWHQARALSTSGYKLLEAIPRCITGRSCPLYPQQGVVDGLGSRDPLFPFTIRPAVKLPIQARMPPEGLLRWG